MALAKQKCSLHPKYKSSSAKNWTGGEYVVVKHVLDIFNGISH